MNNFNYTRYEKPPCAPNCTERSATCHSTCERYKEYKQRKDAKKQAKYNEYGVITDYYRSKKGW